MTLPPMEEMYLVKGERGPHYTVGPYCANPHCHRIAEHVHHIFRRSSLAGDFNWVLIDGYLIGNLTGLCVRCHEDVTGPVGGHKAAIRWHRKARKFYWAVVHGDGGAWVKYTKVGPLDGQPPTPETLAERTPGQGMDESAHCPYCGQARRRRSQRQGPPPGGRRRRKNWLVSVPDDAEDGADILDTFVDDLAQLLGAGEWDERNRRYWTLTRALTWIIQQREQFARDHRRAA
jgi:hypothetical protein